MQFHVEPPPQYRTDQLALEGVHTRVRKFSVHIEFVCDRPTGEHPFWRTRVQLVPVRVCRGSYRAIHRPSFFSFRIVNHPPQDVLVLWYGSGE